jgi:hypothetical protein
MRNIEFHHALDSVMRQAEAQNLTLNQLGGLVAAKLNRWDPECKSAPEQRLRNRVRALYLSWREDKPMSAVYQSAIDLVAVMAGQLARVEAGTVKAQSPGGTRPSELIRKSGPALFYNGKKLYKAGNRTGRGPRRLYEIRPESGKAVNWKDQLRTIDAGGRIQVSEVAAGKNRASRRKSQNTARAKKRKVAARPVAPAPNPPNGALPAGIEDMLQARVTLTQTINDAQGELHNINRKLEAALEQIQDALTTP